jgi:hypothetical protein
LQRAREETSFYGKAQVFIDPDNMQAATVIIPGHPDPIVVHIQTTVFSDLTLGEYLQLIGEYRREFPHITEMYDEHLRETRRRRFDEISTIGVEHGLARSNTSFEECAALAKAVFAGARHICSKRIPNTITPDAITDLSSTEGLFRLGDANSVLDGSSNYGEGDIVSGGQDKPSAPSPRGPSASLKPSKSNDPTRKPNVGRKKLRRPDNLKELK